MKFWKRSSKKSDDQKALRKVEDPLLEALRARVEKRQEHVAVLELEFFNTQVELGEFTRRTEERLTPLENRLEALKIQVKEAREARWGFHKPKPRTTRFGDDLGGAFGGAEQGTHRPPSSANQAKADLFHNPKMEAKIKNLFRELAKRFHPDLTADLEEKAWREQVMTEINKAYAARNLEALQEMAERPDRAPSANGRSREEVIAEMKVEITRLDEVILGLERRIAGVDASPAMQLKLETTLARQNGRDLLSDLVKGLEKEIAELEAELLREG